jgi:uncharacterized protein
LISIAENIAVPSLPGQVWEVISDPSQVVSCISGAELGDRHEDGSFDGTLVVRFGGVRVKFTAQVSLELDEAELTGRLSARGRDGQAATRFTAEATFRVEQGGGAEDALVSMDGEVRLTGKLASLIESGAGIVVSRMTKEFTTRLTERCAGPAGLLPEPATQSAAPAAGSSVTVQRPAGLLGRLRAWWRRLLGKPAPVVPGPSQHHTQEAERVQAQ